MSGGLARFRAKNHPQQTALWGADPRVDERGTPPSVWIPLNKRFGFTLDVAASESNHQVDRYFDKATNGLEQDWTGERVWCNPPYSDIEPWVRKALRYAGSVTTVVVMLLPANRTEQGWWQELIEPYRDRAFGVRTEFLRDRRPFVIPGMKAARANSRPPFGLVVVIFGYASMHPTGGE